METTDPRHGTYAGPSAHRRAGQAVCQPCRTAEAKRRKTNRLRAEEGRSGYVPAWQVTRRLQALQAIGYGFPHIARTAGVSEKTLRNPTYRGEWVYRSTAEAVFDVYGRLSMVVPIGHYANRGRSIARRKGYVPPLAWDNIDDPDEQPRDWQYKPASRIDTFAELVERQVGVSEACRILHVSPAGLEKWAYRTGNGPQWLAMAARETTGRWSA